jgi:hypothetical protein
LPKYEYCRYRKILGILVITVLQILWKILENTGNTSIADTGRFWKILVIPVLED